MRTFALAVAIFFGIGVVCRAAVLASEDKYPRMVTRGTDALALLIDLALFVWVVVLLTD